MGSYDKQYLKRLIGGSLGYVLMVAASVLILKQLPDGIWKIPIAAMPLLPIVYVIWAITEFVRNLDELQRKIQHEAFVIGFAGTAFITLAVGLLENAGLPRLSWLWVAGIMGFLWAFGQHIARKKYQ